MLAMLFAVLLCVMILPFTVYAGGDEPPEEPPAESSATESAPEQQPFTPEGTGTVIDHFVDPNGKEFYTIVTQDGTYFYLIIDHARESNNVYFLIAVSKEDLVPLAEYSESISSAPAPEPAPTPTPEPTPAPEPKKSNTGTLMIVLLLVLAGGGAAYYFKIYRPKQEQAGIEEDDFDDYSFDDTGESEDDSPPWYEDEDETDEYSGDDET